MNLKRVNGIALKEYNHIIRDPRTLLILILMPILQLTIFGYAMRFEIRHVKLAVRDYSHSPASQDLIRKFGATEYFTVQVLNSYSVTPQMLFNTRQAHAVLTIPPSFAAEKGTDRSLQLLIDASDANAAQLVLTYCQEIIASEYGPDLRRVLDVRPKLLYNPDLKSAYFFVPGLIATILVMICALLTSISIAREKELGTLEQLLVSPVTVSDILAGKIAPYVVLALVDALLILGIGMLLFRVPFLGSIAAFLFYTLIYVVAALCLGLMVSTIAKTQQVAMMMALGMTLLPTLMLSGFIFPIRSMPWILQQVTYIVPARYFLLIIRGIMIKGNTTLELWHSGAALAAISCVALLVAARRFKLKLQ